MKPAPFEYRDPATLDGALAALVELGEDATVLAGGQSLVPLLNLRLVRPGVLLDVNRVAGLDQVRVGEDAVRLGALARARDVELDPAVRAALPVLPAALAHVGHPQIRNRTTIGGNVAHADPAAELPAVLAALDGAVHLASATGTRRVGWEAFFETVFTTSRRPDELVVTVELPRPEGMRFAWLEMARRHGDFAVAGVCAGARLQDGAVAELRVAASGVADRPVRLRACERLAAGRELDAALLAELDACAREEVDPTGDVHGSAAYRRALTGVLVRRAVATLVNGGEASR